MVGFPGESDKDFQQSIDVVKKVGFSHIHTFKYSIRKGTRAERMEGQIPDKIKTSRSETIRQLSDIQKFNYRKTCIGKSQKVLIEKVEGNVGTGYGQHYLPVAVDGKNIERNTFHECLITGILKGDEPILIGKV